MTSWKLQDRDRCIGSSIAIVVVKFDGWNHGCAMGLVPQTSVDNTVIPFCLLTSFGVVIFFLLYACENGNSFNKDMSSVREEKNMAPMPLIRVITFLSYDLRVL